MGALLYGVLTLAAGSMFARLLIGGGLALLVSAGLNVIISDLLAQAVGAIGALPAMAYQIFLMGGAGHAMGIIGGAMIARASLLAAGRVLGVTMSSG